MTGTLIKHKIVEEFNSEKGQPYLGLLTTQNELSILNFKPIPPFAVEVPQLLLQPLLKNH